MKQALTVEEQIAKLKNRGMIFDDEEKAKEILSDVGYYRLGFYSFPFEKTFPKLKNRNHQLVKGTTFKSVVELYYFDWDLRRILVNALNRIEVNIRTSITYIVSNYYKEFPTWFIEPTVMENSFIENFDTTVYKQIEENPIIKRHQKEHREKYAPAWKSLEFMTIGNICHLYKSIKDEKVKELVSKKYGCSVSIFINYLDNIRLTRNKCAHGGCLYNVTLPLGVKIHPAGIKKASRQYIGGLIGVIHYVLGFISPNRQKELEEEINALMNKKRSFETKKIITQCAKINYLNFVTAQ